LGRLVHKASSVLNVNKAGKPDPWVRASVKRRPRIPTKDILRGRTRLKPRNELITGVRAPENEVRAVLTADRTLPHLQTAGQEVGKKTTVFSVCKGGRAINKTTKRSPKTSARKARKACLWA